MDTNGNHIGYDPDSYDKWHKKQKSIKLPSANTNETAEG